MNQKIEWYREVLELEPASKVFFPLSQLYASENNVSEAIATLQGGLLRHPDHVEARLLLIELLAESGKATEVHEEVMRVAFLLQSYPSFFKEWSAELAASPVMQDAALALRFFAAALQGNRISWASIIEHGLHTLLSTNAAPATNSASFSAPVTPAAEQADALGDNEIFIATEPEQADTVFAAPAPSPIAVPNSYEAVAEQEIELEADDAFEDEEVFSLRTKSMADVLADQGDIAGAVDIYNELISVASDTELPELQKRLEELTVALSSSAQTGKAEDKSSTSESKRLVDLMETLAQRLEARAR